MKYFIPKNTPCIIILTTNTAARRVALTQKDVVVDEAEVVYYDNGMGWNDIDNEVSYWVDKKAATKIQ